MISLLSCSELTTPAVASPGLKDFLATKIARLEETPGFNFTAPTGFFPVFFLISRYLVVILVHEHIKYIFVCKIKKIPRFKEAMLFPSQFSFF